MAWNWPWSRTGRRTRARRCSLFGAEDLHLLRLRCMGRARRAGHRRDYAALAREGFMRNPVVHRSVRLISETASAIPWLLYDGGRRTRRPSAAGAAGAAEPAPGGREFSGGALRAPAAVRQRLCRDDLDGRRRGRRAGTASPAARPGDGGDRRGGLAGGAGISRGKRQAQGARLAPRGPGQGARAAARCTCRCSIRSTTTTVSRRWRQR